MKTKDHPKVTEIPKDLTCLATWDDISIDKGTYCEFRSFPSQEWSISLFNCDTVRLLLKTQFKTYLKNVEKASKDCAAAVRRLVKKGPPKYISDKTALPLKRETDEYIDRLWFSDSNEEVEAILEGCMSDEERELLWTSQKEVLKQMELSEAMQ